MERMQEDDPPQEAARHRQHVDGRAALNHTADSLRLLAQLFYEELDFCRVWIRDRGTGFRLWIQNHLWVDPLRAARKAAGLLSKTQTAYISPAVLDTAMILNDIPLDARPPGPPTSRVSLNDLEEVLTTDEVMDGVVRGYTLRSKPWNQLPPKRPKTPIDADESFNFQLYNRPVSMSLPGDDDDERRSLTSASHLTDSSQAILDIQAQLMLLTRQLSVLTKKGAGFAPSPIPSSLTATLPGDKSLDSPTSSDDGVYLPGVSDEDEAQPEQTNPMVTSDISTRLPPVTPPADIPPPPPPPPLDFLRGVHAPKNEKLSTSSLPSLSTNTSTSHTSVAMRPSSEMLMSVKLKRTSAPRSPGGTPMTRRLHSHGEEDEVSERQDQGSFLANALKKKFKSARPSLSETEIFTEASEDWEEADAATSNAL